VPQEIEGVHGSRLCAAFLGSKHSKRKRYPPRKILLPFPRLGSLNRRAASGTRSRLKRSPERAAGPREITGVTGEQFADETTAPLLRRRRTG
jgi:hypothetical protein